MDALVSDQPSKNQHGGWRPNSGRPPRDDWQDAYLERLALYGTKWQTARVLGISPSVLIGELERNPYFAQAVQEALDCFPDRCEEMLFEQGEGTRRGNPLPLFALLKKHRPYEYHDKLVTLNVNATVEVPPDQAVAVLQAMLGAATPATRRIIEGERVDASERLVARDSVAEQSEARP